MHHDLTGNEMKLRIAALLLSVSTASFAQTYDCTLTAGDDQVRTPAKSEVTIFDKEVQFKGEGHKAYYFDNFNGRYASSGNVSFQKENRNGNLYFVIADWGKPFTDIKSDDKPVTMFGVAGCSF
jgi:phosphate-selective porin